MSKKKSEAPTRDEITVREAIELSGLTRQAIYLILVNGRVAYRKWANAYAAVVPKVKFVNGSPVVPAANDGPVPAMLANELTLAQNGALDADLLAGRTFYGTDYKAPTCGNEPVVAWGPPSAPVNVLNTYGCSGVGQIIPLKGEGITCGVSPPSCVLNSCITYCVTF